MHMACLDQHLIVIRSCEHSAITIPQALDRSSAVLLSSDDVYAYSLQTAKMAVVN